MAGFLQRGILLYLCLAIAISFAAPDVVFDNLQGTPLGNNMLSWFDLKYDGTNVNFYNTTNPQFSNTGLVTNATQDIANPTTSSSGGGLLGWIDTLYQVFDWIRLFFDMLFSPILLLTHPLIAMPSSIVLIIGIPLVIMFIVGLIAWIRSGIV